ncbi:MAG: hypothetical protein HDT36_03825 [Clostridiales bacterium]|nr:hypothetical protein [Clostridiales bacterium]
MDIKEGTQIIEGNNKAIIEFTFDEYVIYVFQGKISQFDIVVKYRKNNTRIRTPKHIHWVVDCLMKMQGNEELTKQFLLEAQQYWNDCHPLTNNNFETLKELVTTGLENFNIATYDNLNDFGEYSIEFLCVLMVLLSTQEKTNRADAYMFGKIIEQLLETDTDLFRILSTAGFNGRR